MLELQIARAIFCKPGIRTLSLLSRRFNNSWIRGYYQRFQYGNHVMQLSKPTFSTFKPSFRKYSTNNKVTFKLILRDGKEVEACGTVGDSILDVVIDQEIDIDGYGACEGTLACSTCHVIFKEKDFDQLPEPSDEELDMLDLAYGLTDTSRLGCQCILTNEWKDYVVKVPETVIDMRG